MGQVTQPIILNSTGLAIAQRLQSIANALNGIPVLTRTEWNALSTAEKQAYNLVAIRKGQSAYPMVDLLYGADYNTLLSSSVSANILAEALCEGYSAGKSTLGGLTLTGTPVVQSDSSLQMSGSAVYASCPDVEDMSMTVYGVLKVPSGSSYGRLLSICKSASTSREQLMCLNGSSTASLIWASYNNDSTISCNVTQKHVYAISADVGTGKSRFYLDGVYLGEKSFVALGYPYWSTNNNNQYTNADFYYGAVVSGIETDATIIANMQNIMAYYEIEYVPQYYDVTPDATSGPTGTKGTWTASTGYDGYYTVEDIPNGYFLLTYNTPFVLGKIKYVCSPINNAVWDQFLEYYDIDLQEWVEAYSTDAPTGTLNLELTIPNSPRVNAIRWRTTTTKVYPYNIRIPTFGAMKLE